jgi:hypothetical protein
MIYTTQRDLVIEHLEKKRKGITSWDAIVKYGITRLAKYIHELRSSGWQIDDVYEIDSLTHRRWKRYWLVKSPRTAKRGRK